MAVGPEQHPLGRTEWQKSHTHDGVCGRRVGGWGKGLGNINSVGSPPDPGQLGETLRFRCVGCLEVGQQGRGWGLEFAVSVWECVSSLTSLLWRRGPHPAPGLGGQVSRFSFAHCRRQPGVSRFTAQKVFYIQLEPQTRVQPWPCLLQGERVESQGKNRGAATQAPSPTCG